MKHQWLIVKITLPQFSYSNYDRNACVPDILIYLAIMFQNTGPTGTLNILYKVSQNLEDNCTDKILLNIVRSVYVTEN
jgi:hypothetical protein